MHGARRTVISGAVAVLLISAACTEQPPTPRAELDERVALALKLMNREAINGRAFFKGVLDVRGRNDVYMAMDEDSIKHEAYFQPSILLGSPGQVITIRATNWGFIAHTFVIHELGIESWVLPADGPGEAGQTKEFRVTFPRGAQPHLVRCRIHDTGGMVGALVAIE